MTPTAPVAFCLAALIALLLFEWRQWRPGIWVAKSLASASYLATAWMLGLAGDYGQWLFAALLACLLGDLLLVPDDARSFAAGVGAFAVGHILFAVAFVGLGVHHVTLVVSMISLAVAGLAVWRWLSPHLSGEMRGAIGVYIGIIATMVACAYSAGVAARLPMVALAATLFFVSDLAVARDTFVKRAFENRAWGLPLYYSAQLVFVFTLAQVRLA